MSLPETISFDNSGEVVKNPLLRKFFFPLVIILVAGFSFGIGRLSVVGERKPIRIEYDQELTTSKAQQVTSSSETANVIQATKPISNLASTEEVVASKNGSKYHHSHCSGAKQIKEENKIIFASPEVAESAGYTLAANCSPR